jgi:hypothetical protein
MALLVNSSSTDHPWNIWLTKMPSCSSSSWFCSSSAKLSSSFCDNIMWSATTFVQCSNKCISEHLCINQCHLTMSVNSYLTDNLHFANIYNIVAPGRFTEQNTLVIFTTVIATICSILLEQFTKVVALGQFIELIAIAVSLSHWVFYSPPTHFSMERQGCNHQAGASRWHTRDCRRGEDCRHHN